MNDILKTYMEQFRENRHTLRRYTAFVLALAMITTLFVNWQLHGVGISMTAQYQCGEVEHAHTADCYTKVLTCGYEEGELENADELAAAATSQPTVEEEPAPLALEPVIEFVPHEHTDDCYTEVQTLTCKEEEHVHGDDCFDPEDGSLICEKFEHTHDESCYTTEYELTCGLEEGQLVEQVMEPTQSAELAAMAVAEPVALEPVVDTVEPIYHHHTDACYEEVLTCPLPEHHHTVACLSDITATEDPAEWQASNAGAVITGDWNEDLLSVAKTQLGYEQSEKNFEIDPADGVTLRYYTRYGASYNNPYGVWDVMFLTYCLKYAGIPDSAIPQEASVLALRSKMAGMDWLLDGEDGSAADVGDIVIYNKYITRTVAVDSSADGTDPDLDDLFSMDAEFENSAELEDSGASALDLTPSTGAEDTAVTPNAGTQDTVLTPSTVDPEPEQPAEKPVYSASTAASSTASSVSGTETLNPSVVSPAAEPQITTVTDASPVETVGIVSEVDSDAGTLTVISGDVDGKVAEVSLSFAEILGVIDVAAAQYADTYGGQLPTISSSRPNRAPALTAGGTTPLPTADTYDFTDNITSAKLQYRGNIWEDWQDIQDDSDVDEYDQIQAVLEYELPAKTLSSSLNTIVYPLPEALKNFTEDGIVYNSNKEAVGVGKVENGKVFITFYDAYVQKNANGSAIHGSLAFDGEAKEMIIEHDKETTINFNHSYSSTITIKKDYNKKGDLHTSKQTSDPDLENGTVKVWSTYGTADNPIQLEDIMTNIKLDKTEGKGIAVTKNDGTSITVENLTYELDDKGFTGTLPALGADEYYELTYWGVLPSDLKGGNVTTTNKIHAESKNSEDKKIESDASVDYSFDTVKKRGVDNGDGTISWTVTLNENHANMEDWILSDELNGSTYTGTVTITPSTGTSFDVPLPYKFGSDTADTDTTASYTITYKTAADHPYNTSQVVNKATLKDDNGNKKGSSEYGVEVGSKDAYFKNGTGVTDNGDGTLTLNWHVKLIIDKDYSAGWRWYDQANFYGTEQYFTPEQRQDLYREITRVLGGSYYKVSDAYGNVKTDNNIGNWDTIGIIGTQPLIKDTNFEFDFSTTVKRPAAKTDFKNHCSFNNFAFEGTNAYNPSGNAVVRKLDNRTGFETNSSHDYHEIEGELKWTIEVTMTEAFKAAESGLEHIVITDTLPSGVELKDIKLTGEGHWNQTNITKNGDTLTLTTWIYNNPGGITGKGPDITAKISTDADRKQTVTIQISKELLAVMKQDEKITVEVSTKITDDPAKWANTQKDFTNEVRVTDSTTKDWGTASQTQEITYNSHHDAVQKSGKQLDETKFANTVEYTVLVNPDGKKILDNPDIKLTLVDELKYDYDPGKDKQLISLVPSSVAVYKYDKDAPDSRGEQLTVSDYSYLYETIGYGSGTGTESRINRLTFTLPNAKPLAVVYRYLSNASHDITLNNTATLLAQDKKITSVTDSQNVKITSSSWNANAKEGVYAYKVDKDNNGLYLSGAKFSFYAWDSTKNDWSLVTNQIVTDDDGQLVDGEGHNLSKIMGENNVQFRNQAFKLVETVPPAGYILDPDNAYYFYIPDSNTTTYPTTNLPTDLSAYHAVSVGGYLYLTNEKEQSQDYELPSTGGTGTLPYTAVGGTMMLSALAYSFIHHKRRREGRTDD